MSLWNSDTVDLAEDASEVDYHVSPKPMHKVWDGWSPQPLIAEDIFVFILRDVCELPFMVLVGGPLNSP